MLSRAEMRELRDIQKALPEDPRPSLILAHAFVDQEWFSDALDRYELAHALDPSSRGDPRMLRDLLRMVRNGKGEERPLELIRHIFGSEVRVEVELQLQSQLTPPERARFERLLEFITQPGAGGPN